MRHKSSPLKKWQAKSPNGNNSLILSVNILCTLKSTRMSKVLNFYCGKLWYLGTSFKNLSSSVAASVSTSAWLDWIHFVWFVMITRPPYYESAEASWRCAQFIEYSFSLIGLHDDHHSIIDMKPAIMKLLVTSFHPKRNYGFDALWYYSDTSRWVPHQEGATLDI